MKNEISRFIKDSKIASICCIENCNAAYCFHCFYVFDEENKLLFFKSSAHTHHSQLLSKNENVAGSILPAKTDFLALKGVQFTGRVLSGDFPGNINPAKFYHSKLPLALTKPGEVWCIQLETVKMTDNSNVFGKKLHWERTNSSDYSPS